MTQAHDQHWCPSVCHFRLDLFVSEHGPFRMRIRSVCERVVLAPCLCMCARRIAASKVIASLLRGSNNKGHSVCLLHASRVSLSVSSFPSSFLTLSERSPCRRVIGTVSRLFWYLINLHTHAPEGACMGLCAHRLLSNYFSPSALLPLKMSPFAFGPNLTNIVLRSPSGPFKNTAITHFSSFDPSNDSGTIPRIHVTPKIQSIYSLASLLVCLVFPACCSATPCLGCAPPKWPWFTAVPRRLPVTCCRSSARPVCCSAPTRVESSDLKTARTWCSTWKTSTCPSRTSGGPATWLPSCSR